MGIIVIASIVTSIITVFEISGLGPKYWTPSLAQGSFIDYLWALISFTVLGLLAAMIITANSYLQVGQLLVAEPLDGRARSKAPAADDASAPVRLAPLYDVLASEAAEASQESMSAPGGKVGTLAMRRGAQ